MEAFQWLALCSCKYTLPFIVEKNSDIFPIRHVSVLPMTLARVALATRKEKGCMLLIILLVGRL